MNEITSPLGLTAAIAATCGGLSVEQAYELGCDVQTMLAGKRQGDQEPVIRVLQYVQARVHSLKERPETLVTPIVVDTTEIGGE